MQRTHFRSGARRGPAPRVRRKVSGAGEASLDDWLTECRPGWALPGKFHSDETIYRAGLDRVWRTGWLFSGHTCEIPKPGGYFTLQVDADPLVVIRGPAGALHGLHNVCRYRGSTIFDHYNTDDTTPRIKREISGVITRSERKWKAAGLAPTHTQTGMTMFPDAENGVWFSANRTPLVEGYLSETMDGQRVAPLMGDYQDADVGTLRIRTLPNFWNHSSCDHAVSTRLLPAGPQLTAIRVWWLVDAQAEEGRDYQLEKLMPFWQLTSEQDWEICERQQRGVNSSAFVPGPYSAYKEYNVEGFVRWYLQQLQAKT